uniref:Uncharacterized protein n=1 Tax=Glossina palpalis gambiensis TaxID=67801 RepID=A0A1B0BK53_9MUSC
MIPPNCMLNGADVKLNDYLNSVGWKANTNVGTEMMMNYIHRTVSESEASATSAFMLNVVLGEDMSSFKFQWPPDLFEQLVKKQFWPDGVLVLIAVRSAILARLISLSNLDSVEFMHARIKSPEQHLYISCSHVTPDTDPPAYSHHLTSIRQVLDSMGSSDVFVMMIDFNMPSIERKFGQKGGFYVPYYASVRYN